MGLSDSPVMSSSPPPSNPIRSVFSGVQSQLQRQRQRWFKHISEAAEAYKQRDGRNRRIEASSSGQDFEPSEPNQDKTKESEDVVESAADLLSPPRTTNGADHESASPSSEGPSGESTPQASPSTATATALPLVLPATSKMGDGLSPGVGRKVAEPLRLTTTESCLIEPYEVLVSQRPVLTAQPVLTPLEKLRRKDEVIRQALADKQQLVADILHVPREDFETIADLAGEPSVEKEASELVLAAVNQANQLSAVVNEALRVTEEEAVAAASDVTHPQLPTVSTDKLQSIANQLNTNLTHLLNLMYERDEERERLRRELQWSREQLHTLHERSQQLSHSREPSPVVERLSTPQEASYSCDTSQTAVPEVFVDALSGEAETHLEAAD